MKVGRNEACPCGSGSSCRRAAWNPAEGREMVTVLVDDIEQRSAGQPGFDKRIIAQLRQRLGLG